MLQQPQLCPIKQIIATFFKFEIYFTMAIILDEIPPNTEFSIDSLHLISPLLDVKFFNRTITQCVKHGLIDIRRRNFIFNLESFIRTVKENYSHMFEYFKKKYTSIETSYFETMFLVRKECGCVDTTLLCESCISEHKLTCFEFNRSQVALQLEQISALLTHVGQISCDEQWTVSDIYVGNLLSVDNSTNTNVLSTYTPKNDTLNNDKEDHIYSMLLKHELVIKK